MKKVLITLSSIVVMVACRNDNDSTKNPDQDANPMKEASALLSAEAKESGRPIYTPENAHAFPEKDHVFVKSALDIDFTYRTANVTLPLYEGVSPKGEKVYYILTEASDPGVAKAMGLSYAPKLVKAIGSEGVQKVTIDDNGHMKFKGDVDFSPVYKVVAGDAPMYFPPKVANPGAIADAEWSSIVVLPSGLVLNAQMVSNATGDHDRVVSLDLAKREVKLLILDGVQGGKQYFYHLVTDASVSDGAVLEKGVYAPRLAKLPSFGQSLPEQNSALLAFSPVLNGRTDIGSGQDQGFTTSLANGGIDPINVFPIPPTDDNYSPLWDAHVSQWTDKAMQENKVHRIHSLDEQKTLINDGYLTSAFISPSNGTPNAYVGGLKPSNIIINCPVIAHPELPAQ